MSGFIDDFLDFMPDTVYAHPGEMDGYGTFIASGAVLSLPCRIEGQDRLTRDTQGREIVSSVQVIVGGVFNLSSDRHRYTLPSRFIPSGLLVATSVDRHSDEDGPAYEVVNLP